MSRSADRDDVGGWLIWSAAAVVTVGSAAVLHAHPYTTVLGIDAAWPWAVSATGAAALILAAALAPTRRRLVVAVAALAWFLPEWAGVVDAAPWFRVAAGAAGAMVVVVATIAAFEVVGISGRARTVVLGSMVAAAWVEFVVRLGLSEPFTDTECWRHCGRNPLMIIELPNAHALVAGTTAVTAATAALAALLVVRRGVRRGTAGTVGLMRASMAVGAALLVAGLGFAGERPSRATLLAASVGASVMAAGLSASRWRDWRTRVVLGRLIEQLREPRAPGALAGALAATLRDPRLEVLYWSATRGGHVDADGRPASLPVGGRAITTVVRRGAPVAAIVHRADLEPVAVEHALGPAMRLWITNVQLRAATLAELAEVRASEARLAAHAEQERHRLERNLHDGAQQRVVGIALLLRMLQARNVTVPTPALATRSAALLDTLLDDLRRIAADDAATGPRR